MLYGRIIGWGKAVPDKILTNADLEKMVDTTDEWIVTRSGIRERRIAPEGVNTSTLSVLAAQAALAQAGMIPADIDLILVASSSPDHLLPAVSSEIQHQLGANCGAFTLVAGCTGFVYSLVTAQQFIATGAYRTILVIGAEVISRNIDWTDRNTCVLFGDGAGAVVVVPAATPGILTSHLHADGSHRKILCVPGSVRDGEAFGTPFVHMDGGAVFKFAVKVLADVAEEALHATAKSAADIDWVIPHQANIRIMDATMKKLHLPHERLIVTVDLHGNTSAASIPLALDIAVRDGRIRSGQHVMLLGVGGGFTWGSVFLKW